MAPVSAVLITGSPAFAVNIPIGQIAQITNAKEFISPFAESSYLEIMSGRVQDNGSIEIGFRLFLSEKDRVDARQLGGTHLDEFTVIYPSLKVLSDISGLRLIDISRG